jgi:lysine-N-methylase
MKEQQEEMVSFSEPDDYASFVCIGGACPETCCGGWDIVIDAATRARHAKVHDPAFHAMVVRALEVRTETDAAGKSREVAVVRQTKSGRCPFLRGDGLCQIQRQTSEDNLAEVCRTYPRVLRLWQEEEGIRALCVSCAAYAQRLLRRQTQLSFVQRELPVSVLAGLRVYGGDERLLPWAHLVRQQLISMLQAQAKPLPARLTAANDFIWQVKMAGEGHHAAKQVEKALADSRIADSVSAGSACQREGFLPMVLKMVHLRLRNPVLRADFADRLHQVLEDSLFLADGVELYQGVFLPEYSLMLENFLVNEVFKEVFPVEGKDWEMSWFQILLELSFLRVLFLDAIASRDDLPDEAETIETCRLTMKAIGHDRDFVQQAAAAVSLRDFCSLAV